MKLHEFLRLNSSDDTARIIGAIADTSIAVWSGIPYNSGNLSGVNPSGETQKAIDVYSNDEFAEAILSTGSAAEVASEEMSELMKGKGKLSVAMDPLDGSSNVETNNPLGSIFGLYSKPLPCSGRSLIGAAYVTYGSMITLTLSVGKGVHRFVAVREGSSFSFELMGIDIKIPNRTEVYGIGGFKKEWISPVGAFVESLEGRGLRVRYCGTFVGDYNQVLARGGIFAYPELKNRPLGKLRILYETAPMAYINLNAGGYASDGRRDLLDIEPTRLSETSPAYIGSAGLVRELEKLVAQSD